MQIIHSVLATAVVLFGFSGSAGADIAVADRGLPGVMVVDPVTGDRTTANCPITSNGVAVEASGDLVVVDTAPAPTAIMRIPAASLGGCAVVSDSGTGAGTAFLQPLDIAVEASGDLVVTDGSLQAILRVDPVTGDRTIVSNAGTGVGPTFSFPTSAGGIAVEASGDLVVINGNTAVLRVDPVTGDRTIVSDAGTGAGPTFSSAIDLAVEAGGDLVVAAELEGVYRVDPVTGDRVIVSDAGTGAGPAFGFLSGIGVEGGGDLVVAAHSTATVTRVDPVTGDRTIVSDAGTGSGTALSTNLWKIATGFTPITTTTTTTTTSTTTTSTTTTTLAPGTCAPAPQAGCRVAGADRSTFKMKLRKRMNWRWRDGDPSVLADFGDPVAGSASYNVCVYDSSANAQPLIDMEVFPGAGWRLGGGGGGAEYYRYKDKSGAPDGIVDMLLKGGDAQTSPQVRAKAKGGNQLEPPLPAALPLTVQFLVDDGGVECWEAVYTEARINHQGRVVAKGP